MGDGPGQRAGWLGRGLEVLAGPIKSWSYQRILGHYGVLGKEVESIGSLFCILARSLQPQLEEWVKIRQEAVSRLRVWGW